MSLKTRRIIMFSFIGAFFILAPIILFYSSGYRLDIKRYQILKSGTLFIEAKDIKNAELSINGEKLSGSFSTKKYVYNLLPGDYDIKLSKEGYHDWEKKAVIYSGLTTFIQDAILFKNQVPLQIVDADIQHFYPSIDGQKIAYTVVNDPFTEIYLYDLATKNQTLIYRLPLTEPAIKISWAASSKKILLSSSDLEVIIDTQNPQNVYSLKNIIAYSPDAIQWDSQSDSLIYVLYANSIYKLDLFSKTSEKIYSLADKNSLNPAFYLDGYDLYYIEQAASAKTLYKYNFQFKTTKNVEDLGASKNYKFIPSHNNFLSVIDQDQQKLYLIRKTNVDLDLSTSLQPSQEFPAKDAIWDSQEKQLLFYDDSSISTFDTDENSEQFISRYGQIIQKISWYPDLEHFVMLLGSQLDIIDTTQAIGTRNATELIKFDKITNFYLDSKGDNLYFNGQIGKQRGLYQLNLK